MNEIPVYLFTGFMDSGKTSLIKDTLFEQGFAKEGKSLVICCEDGDAEFTDEELEKNNVKLVMVDSEADFTEDFLKKVNTEYQPEQVFLEYNGTWQMGTLMDMELPKYWMIVQQLATVDATTFDMYLANMRTMIMEQLFSVCPDCIQVLRKKLSYPHTFSDCPDNPYTRLHNLHRKFQSHPQ